MLDIVEIDEVATALKKSQSWVYTNAAKLGASKIAGSWIFSQSALIEALENARLKQQEEAGNQKGKHSKLVPGKKKGQNKKIFQGNTDPSEYGLANILVAMAHSHKADDVFAGIDIPKAIEALKRSRKEV